MPVPKRHTTHSKKKMRSATKGLKTISLAVCPQCQAPKEPHHICGSCGYYNNKKILEIEES